MRVSYLWLQVLTCLRLFGMKTVDGISAHIWFKLARVEDTYIAHPQASGSKDLYDKMENKYASHIRT